MRIWQIKSIINQIIKKSLITVNGCFKTLFLLVDTFCTLVMKVRLTMRDGRSEQQEEGPRRGGLTVQCITVTTLISVSILCVNDSEEDLRTSKKDQRRNDQTSFLHSFGVNKPLRIMLLKTETKLHWKWNLHLNAFGCWSGMVWYKSLVDVYPKYPNHVYP